jgi:hypothetical protein
VDAAINRCLKQLLMVRGLKSVTAPPSAPKRIMGPSKDTQKTCTDLNPQQCYSDIAQSEVVFFSKWKLKRQGIQ